MPSPRGRDPEIWQRIDALLSEALTFSESEREALLSRLSADDEALASSLREMLSRSETTDSFLRTPVSPEVLAAAGEMASLEEAGTTIGPYRLLRVLGAGGAWGRCGSPTGSTAACTARSRSSCPGPAGHRGWPSG